MRTLARTGVVAVAAAALVGLGVAPQAAAATGQVVAFSNEFVPTTTWDDPSGCHQLPVATHIIINNTDAPITAYGDPRCLIPSLPFTTIQPGYGSHVNAVGSFRA